MLWWMLWVHSWLDVAPLENMEEDHSFLFLKKNLMNIFFFFLNLKNLNISKELKILIFFFFLGKIKKSRSFEGIWKFLLKIFSLEIFPLEYGFGDFSFKKWRIFLLKMEIFFMITKWRRWRWTRNDEDLFMMIFFWKTYPLNENNFGWKLMWIAG